MLRRSESEPTGSPIESILVTGATDGIGLALAETLSAKGRRVVAVGRRPPGDAPFAADDGSGGERDNLDYRQIDLSRLWHSGDGAALRSLPEKIGAVVHNAGLGVVAPPGAGDLKIFLAVLEVNLWAPIHLAHTLEERQELTPRVMVHLFVSSVMASHPCRNFASYGASKAAVEAFAWNLAAEGSGHRRVVRRTVAVLRPGSTRTGMHYKSGLLSADSPPRGAAPERVAAAAAVLLRRAAANPRRQLRRRSAGRVNTLVYAVGGLSTFFGRHRATSALRRARPFGGWRDARVVVTGGASGIGKAIVQLLAARGADVLVADLPTEEPGLVDYALDLSREEEVVAFAEFLRSEWGGGSRGGIHAVFHCAGISAVGRFGEVPLAAHRAVYEVNLRAPLLLTEELLREREGARALRRGASVVFFSTLGVRTGYPGAASYTATKAGLVGYAEGIRPDCAVDGVHICTVMPGPVRTPHARRYSPPGSREGRRRSPELVAREVVSAVEHRAAVVVPGASAKLLGVLGTLFPRLTTALFRRTLLDRTEKPLLPPQ
jgi:NAD(P)-dependent dehydrogenase (short-subunit alcohol dehydrogenase family)